MTPERWAQVKAVLADAMDLPIAERSAFHGVEIGHLEPRPRPAFPLANVRVMVANVDHYWTLANEIGADISVPIADRHYGLRDFTIADPDGFGIRFASALTGQ